jgi:hypothetical protein
VKGYRQGWMMLRVSPGLDDARTNENKKARRLCRALSVVCVSKRQYVNGLI